MAKNEPHIGIRQIGCANLNGTNQAQSEDFLSVISMFTSKSKIKQYVRIKKNTSHLFTIYCMRSSFMSSSVSRMHPRLRRSLAGISKSSNFILSCLSSTDEEGAVDGVNVRKNTRTCLIAVSSSSKGFILRNNSSRNCTFVFIIHACLIFGCKDKQKSRKCKTFGSESK